MLLDFEDPEIVLCRSDEPILIPEEKYEREGHVSNVVFPCGAVVKDKTLFVYYGGADSVVCVATADVETFLDALMKNKSAMLN